MESVDGTARTGDLELCANVTDELFLANELELEREVGQTEVDG